MTHPTEKDDRARGDGERFDAHPKEAGGAEQAYSERSQVVALAVRLASYLGYQYGVGSDPDELDWPVVYIDLPSGQVSWHFSQEDFGRCFPEGLPEYDGEWDGHTSEEKYARCSNLDTTEPTEAGERERAFKIRRLVQNGYARWASKPYNRKWVKRIEGTPIPTDLLVSIEDEIRRAANLLRTEPGGEAWTLDDLGEEVGVIMEEWNEAGESRMEIAYRLQEPPTPDERVVRVQRLASYRPVRPTTPVEPDLSRVLIRRMGNGYQVRIGEAAIPEILSLRAALHEVRTHFRELARAGAPVEERQPE